jgi:hypothetical protein
MITQVVKDSVPQGASHSFVGHINAHWIFSLQRLIDILHDATGLSETAVMHDISAGDYPHQMWWPPLQYTLAESSFAIVQEQAQEDALGATQRGEICSILSFHLFPVVDHSVDTQSRQAPCLLFAPTHGNNMAATQQRQLHSNVPCCSSSSSDKDCLSRLQRSSCCLRPPSSNGMSALSEPFCPALAWGDNHTAGHCHDTS